MFSSTAGEQPATPDVVYNYHPTGSLKDRQFAGGSVVPLSYEIRERLAKIGDPAVPTYPFSARYAYHANGTVSTAETVC